MAQVHISINRQIFLTIKEFGHKNKGNFYVSLDEEGGYQLRDEIELRKFLNVRTSLENVKNVDIIFNWGKFDNNVCKKIYSKYKKFIISGRQE